MSINRTKIIKYFITFVFPIVFLLIPRGDVYTTKMAIVIAATWCLLAWAATELTSLFTPSLLWPAVLILSGTVTYGDVYSVWVDSTIFSIAAALVLATLLDKVGLLKRMSFSVAKLFGGSYIGTVYSVFAATFVVALGTFACGDAIAAAVTYGAVRAFGLIRSKAGSVLMMAGMLGGVTMRMIIYYPFLINGMQSSVRNISNPNFTITQVDLLVYNWPIIIFCIAFIWLLIKLFVKKEDVAHLNSREYYVSELEKLGKITRGEIVGIGVLLFIFISIFTYSYHGLDFMFSFIIGIAVMFLCGYGDSSDIKKNCSADILFFVATCMAIGPVCNAVGITEAVSALLVPIMQNVGSVASLAITTVVGFILNFCMTPMAMCSGFTGIIYDLFVGIGMNPMAGVMAFYHSTDLVLMPYEFMSFLLFFAYGVMTMKDFALMHALKSALFFIFFLAVFVPYWTFAGLI